MGKQRVKFTFVGDLVKEPGKSSPDPLPMEPYQVAWLDIGG